MEKRLPLALLLAFVVLYLWSVWNPPPEPVPPPEGAGVEAPGDVPPGGDAGAADEPSAGARAGDEPSAPETVPEVAGEELRTHEVVVGRDGEPGHYRLVFSNEGGRLVELDLVDYYRRAGLEEDEKRDPGSWLPLVRPVRTARGETGSLLLDVSASSRPLAPDGLRDVLWRMEVLEGSRPGVEFRYAPGTGLLFTKRVRAVPGTWNLEVDLVVENLGDAPAGPRDFVLEPAGCVPAELADSFYQEPRAIAVGWDEADEEYDHDYVAAESADEEGTLDVSTPPVFVGVHNKYFAFFLRGASPPDRATLGGATYYPVEPLDPAPEGEPQKEWVGLRVPLRLEIPPPGETREHRYVVYAGPKDREVLTGDFEAHRWALEDDLGTFAGISRLLLSILGFFHSLTGNWGVAIILLTICVRAVLFPLNRRSQTSMARYQKKMKRVQPKLEEIKKRHAGNPQKLREAQARIMQEERAYPPLGGCLPVFLQIPVFFGLFSALRTSFDLRQAPFFGWIDDLARPDRLAELNLQLPLLPDVRYLNLLPILMVVAWILQQLGMPKPADEQQARMQKMMMFMPIMFGFFLYNYAAGLSLYMITQSGLGIVEQRVIKKLWPIDDTEVEPKKGKKGCGPFSGALQHVAEKHREQMKVMEAARSQKERRSKQSRRPQRKKRR